MSIALNCLIFLSLCKYALTYASPITLTTATVSSISNFYQDFSSCSCDKTPSLCDNYCCCDSACSSATVTAWTNTYSCLTTSSPIQYLCNQTSNSGYGSFNDLSCVYFTNRASIGYFYQNMQTATLTYPTVSKFSSIVPSVISQSFQSAVSSAGLTSGYTATNQYLLTSSSNYFLAPQPGPGGFCVAGPLNVTISKSSSCYVTATANNCADLNSRYAGTICLKGQCSSTSTSLTITTPNSGGSSCSNVLTDITIAYTIGTSSTSYVLSSVTITPTYRTVSYGSTVIVRLSVTATSPASTSGNPGYRLGKPLTISPSIFAIANPTTGACLTTSSSSPLSFLFGQPAIYSCSSSTPCSFSYYIDSIIRSSISIQKYASQSTDTITVSGTSTANSCNYQTYNLQILYSYSGWSLDPQYYIVGATLIGQNSADSSTNPSKKYLSITWVFTDPQSVSSPPSNFFYTYFNYLWTPLKQKFGLS